MNVSVIGKKTPSRDTPSLARIRRAWHVAREDLLGRQDPDGYWPGHLSSSALATATALSALSLADPDRYASLIRRGLEWLATDQNDDGGWGDSPESPSNVPTTMLVGAACQLAQPQTQPASSPVLQRAEAYLRERAGADAGERIKSLRTLYGKDRTFAVPILANCALAPAPDGLRIAWDDVPRLPFELACFPRPMFRWLRLQVVSYALPALIAIGQLIHTKRPSRNPLFRLIRNAAVQPTLRRLEAIQPSSGAFLEATPLTSFVVMSLIASGRPRHAVVRKGLHFLERLVRPDGSWPIEANLAGWVTSLAVEALTAGGHAAGIRSEATRRWLLDTQHRVVHPYTASPPGGWAWTHLPGGVPDADDTAGALLALRRLGGDVSQAARSGAIWLLDLQNRDGGWPTFCRGWGKLPFDRSAPDLTAHALRALWSWRRVVPPRKFRNAVSSGLRYFRSSQRRDGAWVPIWFGNQHAPQQQNPVYGTARVLAAYRDLGRTAYPEARNGLDYLVGAQNPDGSWGGDRDVPGTVEETALAVDALAGWPSSDIAARAALRGCAHLCESVERGDLGRPAPIGLYFARLWYTEALYPVVWTVGALGRVLAVMEDSSRTPGKPTAPEHATT